MCVYGCLLLEVGDAARSTSELVIRLLVRNALWFRCEPSDENVQDKEGNAGLAELFMIIYHLVPRILLNKIDIHTLILHYF